MLEEVRARHGRTAVIREDKGGAQERKDGGQQHGSWCRTDTEGHASNDGMASAILNHQDHLTYLFAGRRKQRVRTMKGKEGGDQQRRTRRRLEQQRTEGVRTLYYVGEGAHDCDEEGVLGIE